MLFRSGRRRGVPKRRRASAMTHTHVFFSPVWFVSSFLCFLFVLYGSVMRIIKPQSISRERASSLVQHALAVDERAREDDEDEDEDGRRSTRARERGSGSSSWYRTTGSGSGSGSSRRASRRACSPPTDEETDLRRLTSTNQSSPGRFDDGRYDTIR